MGYFDNLDSLKQQIEEKTKLNFEIERNRNQEIDERRTYRKML